MMILWFWREYEESAESGSSPVATHNVAFMYTYRADSKAVHNHCYTEVDQIRNPQINTNEIKNSALLSWPPIIESWLLVLQNLRK